MRVCLSAYFLGDGKSHGPQTWWVGVTLSETRQDYVGLVTWVKVKVKFKIAPIELKLGESDPKDRAGMKMISRRVCHPRSRSGQISNCSD